MDKYAVDLDQVLNDFEYSELTDQYSNTARTATSATTSSSSQNNITKHSINNVFHSLNEYLNTNISVNGLSQIDNNLLENKENFVDVSVLKICQNNLRGETSIKDCNLKTDFTASRVESDDAADDLENCTVLVDTGEETCVERELGNGEESEEETADCTNGGDETTCDKSDEFKDVEENECDSSAPNEEVVEIEAQIEPTLTSERDNSKTLEEEKEEVVEKIGFVDDLNLNDSEINKLLDELEEEGLEENDIISDIVAKDDCESTNEANVEETQVEEPSSLAETQELQPEAEEDLVVKTEDVSVEALPATSDDTLAVTEQNVEEASSAETADSSEEKAQTEPNTLDSPADSCTRPQNLPLKTETEEPQRKINLIGDPGSTPYNNVYVNKEIPRNKEKLYDSETDYSTSSSPTFSDVSTTASTVSIDEAKNDNVKEADVVAESTTENVDTTSEQAAGASDEAELPADALFEDADNANVAGDEQAGASSSHVENVSATGIGKQWLGKEAPLWIPDSDALSCLHCDMKFTVLKRRHHCRACGLVLCAKCCHLRFRLEYLDAEARVCNKCHDILNKDTNSSSGSDLSPEAGNSPSYRPNPNNPLEYCSTVSPLQQAASSSAGPPAVMVPVGVLKRKGSNKAKSNKSVMFCDGIRPGSDLTNLDNDFDYNNTKTKRSEKLTVTPAKSSKDLPYVDPETNTFIPSSDTSLPPTVVVSKTDISYTDCCNEPSTVALLKTEQLMFAIHISLYVHVRIINMSCCINKMAWCFSTEGLINVGQDEIVILLELTEDESLVPKDVFYHINSVYNDAVKGTSVKELGLSLHNASNFLDSKNHAGFVYIRPTFQCLENVIKPKEPYLIGILIHRWETPWAKLFPLRLVLRLGAEYRYYPSPIISTRHRDSVFVEIGHTIINLLADFRNFSYTLPQIRGLTIHMEDKNTTVTIPTNRYDQVIKSMNNSSDHILAFAGNFSLQADSHLVCIQDTQGNENCYSTHAINIHNKPRKVTGASFIVFNGALKSSSGLTAKSNIVEDGLMIQVLPEHMQQIRDSLRAMKNHVIPCGCVNAATDETVNIIWGENDANFNMGVTSAIDNMPLSGIPSIRVHNAKSHIGVNGSRIIRWTEVFIIQNGEETRKNQDPIDMSRVSESIAKATCDALIKYLDLLVANSCQKIGIRTTLQVDNVAYSAGSNGSKLPPIYMKSLDNELIPVLHRITTNNLGETEIVLELVFRILNV